MRGSGLRIGLALLVAVAALAALAPGAAAIHNNGSVIFEESYVVNGVTTDSEFFEVPPEAAGDVVCYLRTITLGPGGAWSATVYDANDRPTIQDTAGWVEPGPVHAVQVPLVLNPRPPTGGWAIDVRASGYSPDVTVTIAHVPTLDDCHFPP